MDELITSKGSSVLELYGVTRHFEEGRVKAVHGVDLSVQSGDYCAIMGRSGSGKSTLLNILGLIDRPTGGTYLVEGNDIAAMRTAHVDSLRAETFGFVFQAFHLVPYLTTRENVELGLTYRAPTRAARAKMISTALDQVGVGHRASMEVSNLSGGERQRVAIARALVRNPAVLLADEPTGNLDEENASAILELFDQINAAGTTLLVVTHDVETADRAGRQLVMSDGLLTNRERVK